MKKKMLLISVFVTLFLVITALAITFFVVLDDEKKEALGDVFGKEKEELFFEPFEITTNVGLSPEKKSRYVKAQVIVSTLDKKIHEEADKFRYPIQDSIIKYMNTLSIEDVTNPQNNNNLRNKLAESIEKEVEIDIEGVYFANYIVD